MVKNKWVLFSVKWDISKRSQFEIHYTDISKPSYLVLGISNLKNLVCNIHVHACGLWFSHTGQEVRNHHSWYVLVQHVPRDWPHKSWKNIPFVTVLTACCIPDSYWDISFWNIKVKTMCQCGEFTWGYVWKKVIIFRKDILRRKKKHQKLLFSP